MADTTAPVAAPAPEAQPVIDAGAPARPVMPEVYMRDPTTREIFLVPVDMGRMLEEKGFIPVAGPDAPPEAPGSFTEGLKAAAEGALGTALPIIGPAAERALFDNAPEQLARAGKYPGSRMLGQAAGILFPYGKVAGAVAKGAEAIGAGAKVVEGISAASKLAAPRVFDAAGRAAEGALARAAPEAIGVPAGILAGPRAVGQTGGALARMSAAAANQATQGGLYGLADAANRMVLGDDLTAEQIMREGGMGVLLGAGLGSGGSLAASGVRGLLGGLGKAAELGGIAASSADKSTAKILIENRHTLAALEKAAPGAAKVLDGATPEAASFILANSAKVAKANQNFPGLVDVLARANTADEAQQVLGRWGKLLTSVKEREAAGVEWQALLTDTAKKMKETGIEHSVEWRPKNIRELAGGAVTAQTPSGETVYWVPRDTAEAAANKVIAHIDNAIQEGRARPVDYHGPEITRLEKMSGQMQDQLFAGKYPDSEKFILRPDKTPEDVFNYIVDVRRQAEANLPFDAASPIPGHTVANTRSLMNTLRSDVRAVLHDRGTWEKLADVQKAYDTAKSAHIDATEAFNKMFLDKRTGEATAAKVDGWLKQVSEGRGRDYTKTLQNYFAASKGYADVMSGAGMAEGPGVRKMIEALETRFNETLAQGHVTQLVEDIMTRGGISDPGTLAWKQAAIVGARAAGLHGVGTVLSALSRMRAPSTVATVLQGIEAVRASFDAALNSGVAHLLSDVPVGVAPTLLAPIKITAQNYPAYAATISGYAGSPDVAAQAIEDRFKPAIEVDPSMGLKLHMKLGKAAQHVITTLPKPARVGALDPAYRPGPSELRKINRQLEVVHDPLRALALAKAGRLTEEHVQALDNASPRIANEIRVAVASKIAENPAAVRKLPRATQSSLSQLLGYDLRWGHSAVAIGGTQRLYQSMGNPQKAGGVGERPRNVASKSASMYSTSTDSATRNLERTA